MIRYRLAKSTEDLRNIMALQRANLPTNISKDELKEQGFVTVIHTLDVLIEMHKKTPSIVAVEEDKLAGYNIAMTPDFRNDIPVLTPMFDLLDTLSWEETLLSELGYIVCGQVCVGKEWRGQGVFDGMYKEYQAAYADQYPVIVTEIDHLNQRSLRAHERVGFETIHRYVSDDGKDWHIVLWDWNAD